MESKTRQAATIKYYLEIELQFLSIFELDPSHHQLLIFSSKTVIT